MGWIVCPTHGAEMRKRAAFLQGGGSGAWSTVNLEAAFARWVHLGGSFYDAFTAGYDLGSAALDAARSEIERLKAFRSGAGSTVWGDRAYVRLFEAAQRKEPLSAANVALLLAEIDGLRAALEAARSEIERYQQWEVENGMTVGYVSQVILPELRQAQFRIAAIEEDNRLMSAVVEAAQNFFGRQAEQWFDRPECALLRYGPAWKCDCGGHDLRNALKALDAAQATVEPEP